MVILMLHSYLGSGVTAGTESQKRPTWEVFAIYLTKSIIFKYCVEIRDYLE